MNKLQFLFFIIFPFKMRSFHFFPHFLARNNLKTVFSFIIIIILKQ